MTSFSPSSPSRAPRELEPRVTELATQHLDIILEKAGSESVDYVAEFAAHQPFLRYPRKYGVFGDRHTRHLIGKAPTVGSDSLAGPDFIGRFDRDQRIGRAADFPGREGRKRFVEENALAEAIREFSAEGLIPS